MNAPRPIEPDALTRPDHLPPWQVVEAFGRTHQINANTRRIAAPYGTDPTAREARRLAVVAAALAATRPDEFRDEVAREARGRLTINTTTAEAVAVAVIDWWPRRFAAANGLADPTHLHAPAGTVDQIHRAAEQGRADIAILTWANALGTAEQRAAAIAIGKALPDQRAAIARARDRIEADTAALIRQASRKPFYHDRYGDTGASKITTTAVWRTARTIAELIQTATDGPDRQGPTDNNAPRPESTTRDGLWETPRLWTAPYTIPHAGMLARSTRRRTDRGRTIASPQRLYTDPMRRAFTRRTRDNGGTVVIDASGSMGLTAEDVTRLLNAAPGASVIAYRTTGHQQENNLFLLARDGRRHDYETHGLPVRPGGSNGLDGPALRYAATIHIPGQPFIWVTDGGYNGPGGCAPDPRMAADIIDATRAVTVHTLPDIDTAEIELDRLARGGQLSPATWPDTITPYLPTRRTTP